MAVSLYISIAQNSQNIANNTSNVTVYVTASWTYGSYNNLQKPGWVKIDGTTYNFTSSFNTNQTTSGSKTLYSKTLNISHNNDGSKTLAVSASFTTGVSSGTITASASKELTKIPRAATIDSAPNFDDEDNPTITYSNPAGNAVTTLEACISLDGTAADIAYRNISKTGSSYTFNLTDAERKVLRQAAKNSNSISVRFYVATTIGDTTYRKYLTKTLSIVNATPTLAPTATDNGSVSKVLTGDASGKVIKGYNSMVVAANATAKKEATIKSYKITCGGKSITTASGTMSGVESGTFTFTVTDSRGNTATKTLTKTLINYVDLTCNLSVSAPTADGNLTFSVKGNYFNGSFGAVANTLAVQYRYKENSGAYGSWITLTPTLSGNTYTATGNLTGLNYQSYYTFQARALDEIYNGDTEPVVQTVEKKVKTTPIFDWGENDFSFHVPITMDNYKQIYSKSIDNEDVLMVSLNNQNQSFFGYGGYSLGLGSTYFDGNSVYIRSKTNINNTAAGTIGGNKAWTNSSDSRLKENIEDIPRVFFDIWLELAPKVFNWNELNNGDGVLHFGLIAQDVIAAFTKYGLNYKDYGFVSTVPVNGVDYYAITYEYYNMLTAQALRHTIAEVNTLKEELARIKGTIVNTEGDTDGQ